MMKTVGRVDYTKYRLHEDDNTKYWGIPDDENWEGLITQNTRYT